jgi:nucleotide-binding universal stress UspA family protein
MVLAPPWPGALTTGLVFAPAQALAPPSAQHGRQCNDPERAMKGPFQRLLVPIDGSGTAQRGLDQAVALAKACDASLVLLSVVEYYPMMAEVASATAWEQIGADLLAHHRRVLDDAHAAASAAGVASEAHLEDAAAERVCDVIVNQARAHRCDLIVMGTHGRRGVQHALVGSDAERVLRMAPCPVLMVRAPDDTA